MEKRVTVLIPTFNSGRYLKDALFSVFNQTYRWWSLILVDDASTDDSFDQVTEFLEDPRVRVYRNPVNIGQAKSLNIGLSHIDSEYLIQLDGDDLLLPHALETMLSQAMRLPSGVAMLYGNFQTIYEDAQGKTIRTLTQRGPKFTDRYDFILKNKTLRPRFYRTNCLQHIGGWPLGGPFEDRYVEDRRVLLRLLDDYRLQWIDELLYIYRKHAQNQTNDRTHCEYMKEWIVRDALKRWGDALVPVFETDKSGWRKVVELKPR